MPFNQNFRSIPEPQGPLTRFNVAAIHQQHEPNTELLSLVETVSVIGAITKTDGFILDETVGDTFHEEPFPWDSFSRNKIFFSAARKKTFVSPSVSRNQSGADRTVVFISPNRGHV